MNMLNKLPKPDTAAVYDFNGDAQGVQRRSDRGSWLRAGAVVGAVLAAVLAWQYFTAKPAPAPATNVPPITVIVPGTSMVVETVTTPGSIAARRDVSIGVQGDGGRITAVLVDAGQVVKRGAVLARIDRSVQTQELSRLEAEVRAAQADAELAAANLDRASALVGRGFISDADIDQRTATRDAARARVAVASARLGEARARAAMLDIRAPADGIILSRAVEVGQVVSPGTTALFRLAEGGDLEMRAQMAEQELARLQPGMPATVTPVGASESFTGEIWLIDPIIDPTSRLGIARIRLPYDPRLRVGAFARAEIKAGDTIRPMLPQSAVLTDNKGNYVFVVGPENVIQRRDITIGETADRGVSIASGLTGAEQVVLSAGAFLRDGEKIDPVLNTAEN